MCVCQLRNPIFCLIPPYMLDQIARHGDKAQREVALRTRAKDSTFRSLRMVAVLIWVRRRNTAQSPN